MSNFSCHHMMTTDYQYAAFVWCSISTFSLVASSHPPIWLSAFYFQFGPQQPAFSLDVSSQLHENDQMLTTECCLVVSIRSFIRSYAF